MNISFTKQQLSMSLGFYVVMCTIAILDARLHLDVLRTPFSFLLKPVIAVESIVETQFSHPITRLRTLLKAQEIVTNLQTRNAELQTFVGQTEFTKQENQALKMEIEKGNTELVRDAQQVREARIISEGTTSFIDKGVRDGVAPGDLLLMQGIFVGKVDKSDAFFSSVNLFSEGSWQVIAQTEAGAKGILTGKDGKVFLTQVRADQKIEPGQKIFTVGSMDEVVLPDLLLGQVENVHQDPGAPFQEAAVDQMITPQQVQVLRVVSLR